jgi:hypothetical protein
MGWRNQAEEHPPGLLTLYLVGDAPIAIDLSDDEAEEEDIWDCKY